MKKVNWALLGILLAGVMFWVTLGSCVYKACQSDSGPNVTCSCEPLSHCKLSSPNDQSVRLCPEKDADLIDMVFGPTVSVQDEWEQCFRWAFGITYGNIPIDNSDYPDLWNQRHGDIFIIKGTDSIRETNKRIFEAWENRNTGDAIQIGETHNNFEIIKGDEYNFAFDPNWILTDTSAPEFTIDTDTTFTLEHSTLYDPSEQYITIAEDWSRVYDISLYTEGGCGVTLSMGDRELDVISDPNCMTEAAEIFFKEILKDVCDAYINENCKPD